MTIATQTNKALYAGDGVQTVFPYTFKVFSSSDLVVIRRAVDGAETTLTLYTHYTVSGVGSDAGGNVTLVGAQAASPPAVGEKLLVKRVVPLTQNTDWVDNDPFPAAVIENAVDRVVCIAQQLQEQVDRAVKTSQTDAGDVIDLGQIQGWATSAESSAAAAAQSAADAAVFEPSNYLPVSQKGASNGVASLDSGGKLAASQIPSSVTALSADVADLDGQLRIALDNIILLTLRQAVGDAAASAALVGGYEWLFKTDELATKTNALYDATGDFYHNPNYLQTFSAAVASSNDGWTGYTGRQIVPAAAISTNGSAFRLTLKATSGEAFAFNNMFFGRKATSGNIWDFDGGQVRVTFSGANGATVPAGQTLVSDWISFSVDETKDHIVSVDVGASSSADAMPQAALTGANFCYKAATQEASATAPTGYSTSAWANYVLLVSQIEVQSSALNMTLASNAVTAAAHPDDVSLFILHKAVDTVAMGTDIKARVSTDGGTNWTALSATFAEIATYDADYKLYRVDFDTSALTGTSIKWEITTYNTKQQRVRAVAAIWG